MKLTIHCIHGFLPTQGKLIRIHFIKIPFFAFFLFIINIELYFKCIISEPNAWTPLGKLISLNITPLHGPLQTRTCPLTILSVINNDCRMLHLVTYFLRDWKNYCIRSNKEQQTVSVKNKGDTCTHGNPWATAAWREYSREASMQDFPVLVLSRQLSLDTSV